MGEFRTWSNVLFLFALIVGVEHGLVFGFMEWGLKPGVVFLLVRALQFGLMGIVFWRHRSRQLLPSSTAERQLWSIWIGYLIGCVAVVLAGQQFIPAEDPYKTQLYILWSLLAGLSFFVMGGSYWGRCYAFGLAFFGLAVLIPALPPALAPLGFGGLWMVSLLSMGLHLRQLAAESESDNPPSPLEGEGSGARGPTLQGPK